MDARPVLAVVLLFCAQLISGQVPKPAQFAKTLWSQMDANHDGKLTLDEFAKGMLEPSGRYSRADFLKHWIEAYPTLKSAGETIFAQVDYVKDGVWKRDDLAVLLPKIDANGDGKVVESEFIKTAESVLATAGMVNPAVGR